jgi:hypothetical protein
MNETAFQDFVYPAFLLGGWGIASSHLSQIFYLTEDGEL